MAVLTPTDCPKSVYNRCVLKVLVGVMCCHFAVLNFLLVYRDFCHRTEADLFLFSVYFDYKVATMFRGVSYRKAQYDTVVLLL